MTKIYTLSILFCLSVSFASAQFDIGQKVIGGNVGFSTTKSENYYNPNSDNQVNVSFSPSMAWFTKPNHLVGIGLMYNYGWQKTGNNMNNDLSKSYNHSIGLNLFSQQFFTLAPKFYFTVTATGSLAYNFGKTTYEVSNNENARKGCGYNINLGLAPGLTYRLTQRLLFDAYLSNLLSVGYTHTQYKGSLSSTSDDKSYQNSFGVSYSLSNTSLGNIGLGFRWLLKK